MYVKNRSNPMDQYRSSASPTTNHGGGVLSQQQQIHLDNLNQNDFVLRGNKPMGNQHEQYIQLQNNNGKLLM